MSIGTDPGELIERLISPNGKAPHKNGASDDDALAEARATVAGLAKAKDGATAIREALATSATMEAIVLVASKDRAAYESLRLSLRATAKAEDVKALDRAVAEAKRQAHKYRKVTRIDGGAVLARVKSTLDDAPVSDDAVVPMGWRLGPFAVAREQSAKDDEGGTKSTIEVIAPAPIVISGRLANVNDGTEAMRLAWRRDNIWRQATINRDVIANGRELVKVSGLGLPVTSGTSGDIVRYLAAYEAANLSDLPRARVSHQLGWQGERGSDGFLWGRSLIKPDGKEVVEIDLEDVAPADWQQDWLAFRGDNEGDEQLASGYGAAGSFDDWRRAVEAVADYPSVVIALYASLAAPLLEILDCQNFVVDWSHMTSTGKTTVLRLAASVWGAPDERSSAAAMQTWDVTRVWLERAAATLQSIPLILDDTKRARKADFVAQTIYDLVSGRGRGRGSPLGIRRTLTWRTVLLSSGEQRITDFSQDGGTRPRVLELWGMPFGGTDQATGAVVQRLTVALLQHYGHAGPRFVQFLLQRRDQWPKWRDQLRETQQHFLNRAKDNPFAGRIAEPVAVLTLTEALACAALELPWGFRDTASGLWETLAGEASEADRAAAALEYVMSWAVGHQEQFYGRSGEDMPNGGWVGRWDNESWKWIGFLPDRLTAILDAKQFDTESTIRLWRDRGWLMLDDDGRRNHRARIGSVSSRMVAILRTAWAGGDDDATE